MQRANAILSHPIYIANIEKNSSSEKNWRYCKHDIVHFMDVARIAYILNLEDNLGFPKELIYAAALLHDITKWKQISENIPHNESAIEPATKIMQDCGFSHGEISLVCAAILNHRTEPPADDKFSNIIFKADKLSRACCFCSYDKETCNWDSEKKNAGLLY